MATTKTPESSRISRRRLVIVALAIVAFLVVAVGIAVLAGVAWFTTTPESGPPPVTPSSLPAGPIPDGKTFAYMREIGEGSLTVDPARLLSGDEARRAAEADGVIGPGTELPNDFYLQNTEVEDLAVSVEGNADVTVLTFDSSGAIVETNIELADLVAAFTGDYPGVAIYGLAAGEFPVTLTVEDGVVVHITQVYLP